MIFKTPCTITNKVKNYHKQENMLYNTIVNFI